jgi:signal transduction histidine kinase
VTPKPGVTVSWNVVDAPLSLRTDPVKLRMILKNLVGNAIKFTDRGNVWVEAARRHGGIELVVRDTGIGIPTESLLLIFEAFRQAGAAIAPRYGGAGLGLYIVRKLLEALGGAIEVNSSVGDDHGSTFRVWLPLRGGDEAALTSEPPEKAVST